MYAGLKCLCVICRFEKISLVDIFTAVSSLSLCHREYNGALLQELLLSVPERTRNRVRPTS